MLYNILTINPGSTSTKIAVYNDENIIFEETLRHSSEEIMKLTGGMAYGKMIVDFIREKIGFIAPIVVYPGEDEMLALAQGALRVLSGEEAVKEYR